jgi:hypothetical protein
VEIGMLQAIFEALLEGICAATGEIVLWIVTFGRRKPFQTNKHGDLSKLIGLLFWVSIVITVAIVFLV